MVSVRKRKNMVRRFHNYCTVLGYVPDEQEYSGDINAPFRRAMVNKYLGSYNRMVAFLERYYPQWATAPAPEAPVFDMSALEKDNDE